MALAVEDLESRLSLSRIGAPFAGLIAEIDAEWNPKPWGQRLFDLEFGHSYTNCYGIFDGEELAGYGLLHVVMEEAHMVSFGIVKTHHGRGLGRMLLSWVLNRLAEERVRSVTLEVRPSNLAARGLYASLGFIAVGVRRHYYSDNGEDAVSMRCELVGRGR